MSTNEGNISFNFPDENVGVNFPRSFLHFSPLKVNREAENVTFDDINKSGFSRQKLQVGTFESNPILSQFPRHGVGNVGEISLRNGSTIYITTDHNQYRHVEGKSLDHVILDEAQYQDIQYFERVVMTMMQTK